MDLLSMVACAEPLSMQLNSDQSDPTSSRQLIARLSPLGLASTNCPKASRRRSGEGRQPFFDASIEILNMRRLHSRPLLARI
jgi:hypothetical protein